MTETTADRVARPFPRGVRPHFFAAAEKRRALEQEIFAVLLGAGYREIILPIIDSSEPYRDVVDESSRRRSYRFIDRDGDLLEIRSDFTPMVARSLGPMLDSLDLPLRVGYRGDVVRCESGRLGNDGEFYQIGAELLGLAEPEGDAEMLALAVAAVRAGGVEPSVVVSNEELVERVIEELDGRTRVRLRRAVAAKQIDEAERLSGALGVKRQRFLLSICSGSVGADDLRDAGFSRIVSGMERVTRSVDGASFRVAWDEIEASPTYYTGIRFKLFDESGRVEIGRGGRYDDLYAGLGAAVSAVGFTISLDCLEGVR